ncbi:MAG: DUF309 domain-containing protein [Thermus sp.]|uniref:DUF309 domain-containing protein n=1 Tax=Thermus sp. TaxID=275 RepID=UPI00333143B5
MDWSEALALWRKGRYFEVHEVLETAWLRAKGEEKRLLKGIILLAAALHQRALGKSGMRNFQKALRHLEGLENPFLGVDWVSLLEEARRKLGA